VVAAPQDLEQIQVIPTFQLRSTVLERIVQRILQIAIAPVLPLATVVAKGMFPLALREKHVLIELLMKAVNVEEIPTASLIVIQIGVVNWFVQKPHVLIMILVFLVSNFTTPVLLVIVELQI
jgi:hypothetical protein